MKHRDCAVLRFFDIVNGFILTCGALPLVFLAFAEEPMDNVWLSITHADGIAYSVAVGGVEISSVR